MNDPLVGVNDSMADVLFGVDGGAQEAAPGEAGKSRLFLHQPCKLAWYTQHRMYSNRYHRRCPPQTCRLQSLFLHRRRNLQACIFRPTTRWLELCKSRWMTLKLVKLEASAAQ